MKYKLTEELKERYGTTFHRIVALENFTLDDGTEIRAGDKGGWVQSEHNLSQSGLCWVSDEAMVFDNATISGDANIRGSAVVFGNAMVYDNAVVGGNARVEHIAVVCGNTAVYDNACISGSARICDNAQVFDDAMVCGDAQVCDDAQVSGRAVVYDDAKIFDKAQVSGISEIGGNAEIGGRAEILRAIVLGGNASIKATTDCLTISNLDINDDIVFYKSKDNKIYVDSPYVSEDVDVDTWVSVIDKKYNNDKYLQVCHLSAELAKLQIKLDE